MGSFKVGGVQSIAENIGRFESKHRERDQKNSKRCLKFCFFGFGKGVNPFSKKMEVI
jgi:hypothetical protein